MRSESSSPLRPSGERPLPLEAASRGVTPLRRWSAAALARVASDVEGALAEWRSAWGLRQSHGVVRCTPADGAHAPGLPGTWDATGIGKGVWCRLGAANGVEDGERLPGLGELARALFGAEAGAEGDLPGGRVQGSEGGTIAGELVLAAWADLGRRLGSRLQPAAGLHEEAETHLDPSPSYWSGWVVASAPCAGATLQVLVAPAVVERLMGAPEPHREPRRGGARAGVWEAAAHRPVRVDVQLHAFDMDLGGLASVRAGDVVRTTHRLDEPLEACFRPPGDGPSALVCRGFLGSVGGARALELASLGPPDDGLAPEMQRTTTSKERVITMERTPPAASATAQPIALTELGAVREESSEGPAVAAGADLSNPLRKVRVRVTVNLGGTELTIGELLAAKAQQVLRLDQSIHEPVDVMLEGQVVARGTLVAVENSFGVQITEVPTALALPLATPEKCG